MAAYARRTPSTDLAATDAATGTASGTAVAEVAPAQTGAGDVEAQHDSPTHIGIGDSVPGEGVVVHGIVFTPGELAALVDFVGDLTNLDQFTMPQLASMKALLAEHDESARSWDAATGGLYSKLAQGNESHFAPGPGANFRDSFVTFQGQAVEEAIKAQNDPDPAVQAAAHRNALLYGYTAEHYLQDAFSAGHQVAAGDIEAQVSRTLDAGNNEHALTAMYPMIAGDVFDRVGDTISCWGVVKGPIVAPIDTAVEFGALVVVAAAMLGRDGVNDAVRQFVHEDLASIGVEVSSKAHPEPWVTRGDHDLDDDAVGVAALQAALAACRDQIALEAVPGVKGADLAARLFDHHAPTPTEGRGDALVQSVLDRVTAGPVAIAAAVTETTIRNIVDVMDSAARETGFIQRIRDPEQAPPHDEPDFPRYGEREGESRTPEGPQDGAPLEERDEGPDIGRPEQPARDPHLGDRLPTEPERPDRGTRRDDRREQRRARRDERRDARQDRREQRRDDRRERRAP